MSDIKIVQLITTASDNTLYPKLVALDDKGRVWYMVTRDMGDRQWKPLLDFDRTNLRWSEQ